MEWTRAQWKAIKRQGNTLVSAAAGSGKTATLTDRIIKLLKYRGASLDEMLIVTFTKASAADLKKKIGQALVEASKTDRGMARHLASLPSAEISTIHSFCSNVLRRNFSVLSLTPDFGIADEAENDVIINRALADTIDDYFRGNLPLGDETTADIVELADALGKTKESGGLDVSIKTVYGKLCSIGEGSAWLLGVADRLFREAENDFFDTTAGEVIKAATLDLVKHHREIYLGCKRDIEGDDYVTKKYFPALNGDLEIMNELEKAAESSSYTRAFNACKAGYEQLVSVQGVHVTAASLEFKECRDKFKSDLDRLKKKAYSTEQKHITEAFVKTARSVKAAGVIIGEFEKRIAEAKRDKNVLSYNDLELLTLKLLENGDGTPTSTALSDGKKYKYIFVDEYQDTNSVQDRIFRAIGYGAQLFFVGDIKQSIYRFRGADPGVFKGYRKVWSMLDSSTDGKVKGTEEEYFAEDGSDDIGKSPVEGYPDGRSIFMSHNFRCSLPIVDFVNSVSRYMFPAGGIPFSEEDCLVFGNNNDATEDVEIHAIQKFSGEDTDEDTDAEREFTARRICELIRDGYSPKDIAVLIKSANTDSVAFEKTLTKYGIPVKSEVRRPFLEEKEVTLVFDLLRTVDNPMDDVSLAGALCSSVFEFNLEDLVKLRLSIKDGSLWESLCEYVNGEDGELSRKCERAVSRITRFRETERGMSSERFIDYLYSETHLLTCPEVEESPIGASNLRKIRDTASSYESAMFGGLYGFLEYADRRLSVEYVSSAENDNAVTLISIHKSKGLEYPVCFLSMCHKDRNTKDETSDILFDRDLGLAFRLAENSGLVRCSNPYRAAISEKIRKAGTEEDMRVLYVAMTRAKRKLIVTGEYKDVDKELEKIKKEMAYSDIYTKSRLSTFFDYILSAYFTDGGGGCTLSVDIISEGEQTAAEEASVRESAEEAEFNTEKIIENMNYEYPYGYLGGIPSKLAVSKLYPAVLDTDEGEEIEVEDYSGDDTEVRPRFMSGDIDYTPAQKGTSTHVVMQFADFNALKNGDVRAEIDRLVERGFITKEMASLVSVPQIKQFSESPLLDRMLGAKMLVREHRFNVSLPAVSFTLNEELKEKLQNSGETVTVQGVFDCVFEDSDGKLILIDYKTDRMSSYELTHYEAAAEKLIERHKEQLGYYAVACEHLFGRLPDETYIYSLPLGRTVEIPIQ